MDTQVHAFTDILHAIIVKVLLDLAHLVSSMIQCVRSLIGVWPLLLLDEWSRGGPTLPESVSRMIPLAEAWAGEPSPAQAAALRLADNVNNLN